jgi:hypothetical protein
MFVLYVIKDYRQTQNNPDERTTDKVQSENKRIKKIPPGT